MRKFVQRVNLKVGKMRKEDWCVVYPPQNGQRTVFVQGARLAMRVDLDSGKAIFNYRHGSEYPNRGHLIPGMKGVMADILPEETIKAIEEAIPQNGDYLGSSVCQIVVK